MKIGFKWDIIFKKNEGESFEELNIGDFHTSNIEEGKFIADPFIIKKAGINYVFYELCDYKKGVIACSTLIDNELGPPIIVLNYEEHLSYPYLFEEGDDLYMIPESHKLNKIIILKCINFPTEWKEINSIKVSGKDTSIFKKDKKYYLITTIGDNNNITLFSTAHIEKTWDKILSKNFNNFKTKRNGGKIFDYDGNTIRPTQYDIREYGESLSFNKITIEDNRFSETEIKNYKSPPHSIGIHHFDMNEDYIVMDINKKVNYNQKKYF